jgi:hypothetical protein
LFADDTCHGRTAHLYGRLRDADPRVRKTALMVLTHLILNDMIKVGPIRGTKNIQNLNVLF